MVDGRPSRPLDADDPGIGESLRRCGLRASRTSRLVLALLRESSDHPTVSQILGRLASQGHSVRLPTLYQSLDRMAQAGLISSFLDDKGLLRFDPNISPHHHVRCTACGLILDACASDRQQELVSSMGRSLAPEEAVWEIDEVKVELRGRCPNCRAAAAGR